MCQAPIVAPATSGVSAADAASYQAWALEHGNTAAAIADAGAPTADPSRSNFASTSYQSLIHTPDGRDLVVGTQVDANGNWAIRAQELISGQIAWETPYTYYFSQCPGMREVALREGVLYIAAERRLRAFDPNTGRQAWDVAIPTGPESEYFQINGDEMRLVSTGGVALLTTSDDQWLAFAVQDGRLLWQRESEGRARVAPGVGFWLPCDEGIELVGLNGEVLVSYSGDDYGDACVAGPYVVLECEKSPEGNDDRGVLLINLLSGAKERFISAPEIEVDEGDRSVQACGGLLLAGQSGTGGLYRLDPKGPPPKNGPGFFGKLLGHTHTKPWAASTGKDMLQVLRASQDALCVEVSPPEGGARSIRVIDPQTLAVRYDSGPLPHDAWNVPLIAAGPCMVYVIPTDENGQGNDVICIHTTTGNELWRKPIGHYSGLAWSGERVLVQYDTNILLLSPMDGAVIGSYPAA
jgi:outer membrane protein assembly factor BamB